MKSNTCHNMLKQCVTQGFSLYSISIATKIPVDELQKLLDDSAYVPSEQKQAIYLGVFLMQLCYTTPTNDCYYKELLNSLTTYFEISEEAIANYVGVTIEELISFESSPNRNVIEKNIAHLFNTFVRDARFSI